MARLAAVRWFDGSRVCIAVDAVVFSEEFRAVRWFDGSRVCIRIMCFRIDGEAGGIRKRVQ